MSGSSFRARARRAREIGIAGFARRLRSRAQRPAHARARLEWHARYGHDEPDDTVLRAAFGAANAQLALPEAFRDVATPARFWFDAANAGLRDAFATRHPDAHARIVREAEAALAGDLSFVVPGGSTDWHAALPGGGRWPLLPAADLGIGADAPRGDVRLTWEIGRCAHVVRLAQAAWLTREPRFAQAVAAALLDFAAANPPGRGIGWAHAQEVALRAIALLWAFHLTRDLGAFDEKSLRVLLWQLLAHGDYVAAHLADHPTTHNHLVSEAAGLAVLGIALAPLRPAAHWRRTGLRLLFRELEKQVDAEGMHGEHSTHYHAFVLDSFVAVLLLADRASEAVPARARAQIGAMTDALALLLRADGTLPAIGDTDAGRAWRTGGDPLDRRDLLAAAAVAFARREWGAIAGDADGAFWLTAGRAIPGAGEPPPPGRAHCFADAGIAVARSGWDRGAEIALFRCGPTRFRADVARSHMHADALSLLWRIGDDDVLVDPGTYLYSEGGGWRAALRGAAAHSCVLVDGRDQADVRSQRFGIRGERVARWLHCSGDASHLLAAAEHPASGTPRVRRRIAWLAGGTLALCDDVVGDGAHRVESWLQLPHTAGDTGAGAALLQLASGRPVRVQCFTEDVRLDVLRPAPGAGPGPGWRAPRYGVRVPGTSLHFDAGERRLPARLVTLIQAGDGARTPAPGRIESAGDGACCVVTAAGRVWFEGDTAVRIERAS